MELWGEGEEGFLGRIVLEKALNWGYICVLGNAMKPIPPRCCCASRPTADLLRRSKILVEKIRNVCLVP